MENTSKELVTDSSSTIIFEIPGEPAIVINGVPDNVPDSDATLALKKSVVSAEDNVIKGFGEWLEGREVKKLFGEQYYSGTVIEYDKETGWYRVVYEDGDIEDLDWHELQEVLLPLDILVPLKTIALRTLRHSKKQVPRSGGSVVKYQNRPAKYAARKGQRISENEDGPFMKFDNS